MRKEDLLEQIRRLPIEDRIELLADAWDEITDTNSVPIPEWHVRELDHRLTDPHPPYVSQDEVHRRLDDSTT